MGKEFLCPKTRTREAGGRVVAKLSMRLRRMRRRVLDVLYRSQQHHSGSKLQCASCDSRDSRDSRVTQ
eukprot:COSAG01_NODE_433_length_17113_cov_23.009757_2_plen_68_part_00